MAWPCQCGRPDCTTWYVVLADDPMPVISAFSERQVGVVVNALNALDGYRDHTDTHTDR